MKTSFNQRRVAEIISFTLSSIMVLFTFAYLVFSNEKVDETEFLKLQANLLVKDTKLVNGSYLVPIEVKNDSSVTPSRVVFEVLSGDDKIEVETNYLSKKSSKKLYVALEKAPVEGEAMVRLRSYEL